MKVDSIKWSPLSFKTSQLSSAAELSFFFFNFLKVLAVVKYTNKTYHLMICKHIVQQCLYIHCCATNLLKFFILQNQNIKPIK